MEYRGSTDLCNSWINGVAGMVVCTHLTSVTYTSKLARLNEQVEQHGRAQSGSSSAEADLLDVRSQCHFDPVL